MTCTSKSILIVRFLFSPIIEVTLSDSQDLVLSWTRRNIGELGSAFEPMISLGRIAREEAVSPYIIVVQIEAAVRDLYHVQ